MADAKVTMTSAVREGPPSADGSAGEKAGTNADECDMFRMGKKQEMKRNFQVLTIFGFTMVLMQTWQAQFSLSTFVLTNGGTAGAIWMYLITFTGFFAAIISMAEMASMAPTTGGQYHWVSEFAPRSSQRILSYIVGWLCVLGWQVANTSVAYLTGTVILGLATLIYPEYTQTPWHGVMVVWAVLTIAVMFNTFFASKLPMLEGAVLVLHICGFFAIMIVLWILADMKPASEVFFTFSNGGGWSSQGLSCLVGMLTPIFSFLGPDSATHMSEELRDASRNLPLAMVATAITNGLMGFVAIITYCMAIGDLDTVLASKTGYPFIQTFYNATHSNTGTALMVSYFCVMSIFGCVTNFATSSRQLWAFSRDHGTPFSSWLAHIRQGWDIPFNALLACWIFSLLLTLINLGSTVALNIVTSLTSGALLFSYVISITCVIIKRVRGEELLPRKFNLGRVGLPLNIFSVLFLSLCFIMNCFPISPHNLTTATLNWNIVIFFALIVVMGAYFVTKGRKEYLGPVAYVRKAV